MTDQIKNICVFSSSKENLDKNYYETAVELGILMGKSGFNLIYGGRSAGTMLANANAVKKMGGKIIGVMPESFYKTGVGDNNCDEFIVTKCMQTRKAKIDELSDAFIALPGGFGTLDELSEMILQKQLGYSNKAIVILNTNGFFNHLLDFFAEVLEQKFASENLSEIYFIAKTPQEAIEYLKNYAPKSADSELKIEVKN